MVGNDIVDLGDPDTQSSATHPRFDARVFTTAERALIAVAPERQRARWLLWAAKESAYKVLRKADPLAPFVPNRLAVRFIGVGFTDGMVESGARRFHVVASVRGTLIHAIASASADALRRVVWGVTPVGGADSSAAVRQLAIRSLAPRLGVAAQRLAIVSRERIPQLCLDGLPVAGDLSLSHHGRYAAFVWQACAPGDASP